MTNDGTILEAAGAAWDNIVKATWYMTDRQAWPKVEAVAKKHFGRPVPGPRIVEIVKLVLPAARLEPGMCRRCVLPRFPHDRGGGRGGGPGRVAARGQPVRHRGKYGDVVSFEEARIYLAGQVAPG